MISVVIPLYNKERSILTTLNSILVQKAPEYEVVVIDDGSTDRSAEVVESVNDPRIRLVRQKNAGPSAARNRGVREARFPWIVFLDADDVFENDSLQHFANLILEHPDIKCFVCNFSMVDKNKTFLYSSEYADGIVDDNFKEWFCYRLMPCQGSTAYQKELLIKYPYDEHVRRYEDAQMLFSIFRTEKIYRSSKPSFRYVLSANEASKPRPTIKQDYLGYLQVKPDTSFWEKMVIYGFYREAVSLYPEECKSLYKKSLVDSSIVLLYFTCRFVLRLHRIILKLHEIFANFFKKNYTISLF